MAEGAAPFEAFRALLPLTVIKAERGVGSFLTFHTNAGQEVSVRLWVYLCEWKLTQGDQVLDSDQMDERLYASALKRIAGIRIVTIDETSPGSLLFGFSNGHRLEIKSDLQNYEAEDDLILCYLNEGCFVCYSHERGFYFES